MILRLAGKVFPCAILFLLCLRTVLYGEIVVAIGQNFTGSTYGIDSPYNPPDCNGVAGPHQFIELINGRFTVYAKTNGSVLQSLTSSDFWTGAGLTFDPGVIPTDPRIIYDPLANRWFASAMDYLVSDTGSNRFLLAVSAGGDPTGPWQGFAFTADPIDGNFADFPTFGLDTNGVYLAAFMFGPMGGRDVGQTLVSIPKADLLAATPTVDNRTWFGVLDSTNFGYVIQPSIDLEGNRSRAPVLTVGDLGYDYLSHSNIVCFAIQNAAGPGPATLSAPQSIEVDDYSVPINPTQPDGNNSLDDGDARISAKVYQVGATLYAVHSCEVDGRTAIRWYQINATTHGLLQSGTITDTNLDLFYPSIAANPSGVVVIGCNGCSTNTFISSFVVVGETVDGVTTFGDLLLLKSGLTSYNRAGGGGISRWGDYSSTCGDPADTNRFWTMQMIPISSDVWATQITEILTGQIPWLTLSKMGEEVFLSWPACPVPFDLETASDPTSPDWAVVSQTGARIDNGHVYLKLSAAEGAQFYRLHKQ